MQKLLLFLLLITLSNAIFSKENSTVDLESRPRLEAANVIDHGDLMKKRKKRKRKKIVQSHSGLKEAEQQLKEWLHFLQESEAEALASEAEAEDRGLNNSERRRQAKLRYELH